MAILIALIDWMLMGITFFVPSLTIYVPVGGLITPIISWGLGRCS